MRERSESLELVNKQLNIEVAERKRMQLELNRFFSISHDLLCLFGFDGFFKFVNPAFEKNLRLHNQRIIIKNLLWNLFSTKIKWKPTI